MDLPDKYPCSGCGACCRKVSLAVLGVGVQPKEHPLHFPYKWDESGCCEMLVGNQCSVYEDRPLMCRVDAVQPFVGMTKKKWYKLNVKACNSLMDKEKLDLNLRIKF